MSAIIEFKNIYKCYGENAIIEDFNLTIDQGEFVTIVGTSGCGKTTILKMVNALITPTSGEIYVDGENINSKNIIDLRRNIGYAIQGSVLFPHMNVEKNIAYVPNLINRKDKEKTKSAVEKWMNIVGLDEDMKTRFPSEISGGQQQKVAIARSLASSPKIVLMDEPFGAVDEITRKYLQNELKRIYEHTNVTILFVTHDINEALKLGTKVLVMHEGCIQQFDTPNNLVSNPANIFVRDLIIQ